MPKSFERVVVGLVVGGVFALLAGCGGAGAAPGAETRGGASKADDDTRDGEDTTGDATGGSTARDGGGGSQSSVDYSKLVGWVSFHPGGADKTYNTGFDGTNDYVVPMTFFAAQQPKLTFGDPAAAESTGIITITKALVKELPDQLDGKIQLVFVKAKKAGQTTITATAGSLTQTATLKIAQYAASDVAVGENRYTKGSPSCASCHEKRSVHNPGLLADLSDETILGIAVEGKPIQRINPQTAQTETVQPNGGNHKWQVTAAERKGLMAYLRSRNFQFQLSGAALGR